MILPNEYITLCSLGIHADDPASCVVIVSGAAHRMAPFMGECVVPNNSIMMLELDTESCALPEAEMRILDLRKVR
jgi:hypothetical protein